MNYKGMLGILRKPSNTFREIDAILKFVSAISFISKGSKFLTKESNYIASL